MMFSLIKIECVSIPYFFLITMYQAAAMFRLGQKHIKAGVEFYIFDGYTSEYISAMQVGSLFHHK